jgi:hypothetical protein
LEEGLKAERGAGLLRVNIERQKAEKQKEEIQKAINERVERKIGELAQQRLDWEGIEEKKEEVGDSSIKDRKKLWGSNEKIEKIKAQIR